MQLSVLSSARAGMMLRDLDYGGFKMCVAP